MCLAALLALPAVGQAQGQGRDGVIPTRSQAQATEWIYQIRPGDTLWDLGLRYLDSPDDWHRLQRLNHIEDPGRLAPGSQLRIPIEWLRVSPAPAQVVAIHGEVRITDVGGTTGRPATNGDTLVSGSRIETGADAGAGIVFADGSYMLVQADSVLIMDTLSAWGGTGMVDTRIRLQRGRIENRVRPRRGPAGNFIIDTPPATTTVRGTEFRVFTDEWTPHTITEVVSGEVEVYGKDGVLVLLPHQAAIAATDAADHRTTTLLPAPDLSPMARLPLRPGDTITWPIVSGARGYRARFVQTADGRVLSDRVVETPAAIVPLLDNGAYRFTLRAIDGDGVEGLDAARELTVHGTPEPPFVVEPGPGSVMPPGPVTFRWTEPAQGRTYRLQVATDPDFQDDLIEHSGLSGSRFALHQSLPIGHYHWRLATIDDDGHVGPFGDVERFELRKRPATPDGDSIRSQGSIIRWRGGENNQRYHIQVARDAAYTNIVFEDIIDEPAIATDRIGKGRWHLRVRLIDADGYEGQFSDSQYLRVGCGLCRLAAGISGAAAILLLL